jgi:hypothetical protein
MSAQASKVTCGNCLRSWDESKDPAPSALCHWCHGRGYSDHEIANSAQASKALCEFVRKQAPPHYACSDAPNTWRALRDWGSYSQVGRDLLPVFDGGCDNTIYPDAATNHAFRAWHDSIHLVNGYSFSFEDECKVGLIHMQQARRAGLSKRDQDMLVADTIGQITYYNERGDYVQDQARFVADVLAHGLRATLDTGRNY